MSKTQIAFDFGELPQKPLPENILVSEKVEVPASKDLPSREVVATRTAENSGIKEKSTRGRKSMKEMSAGVELINVPEDDILFQKMYYTIGKVAEMFKVNQSLIRLWENEFDVLKPKKNGKGDRLFRPEDIKNIQLIYHLMRERKYTMEGAKDFIKKNKRASEKFETIESLKKLKVFLIELKANL
jgi:DNA-binding transcriptional MerR regulator